MRDGDEQAVAVGEAEASAVEPGALLASERPSSRSGVVRYSLVNYGSQALGLITGPLTVRALGASGRGVVAELGVYGTILGLLFTLGVESAIAKEAAQRPEQRPNLIGAALKLTVLVTPFILLADAGLLLGPLRGLPTGELIAGGVALGLAPVGVLILCLQAFTLAGGALVALGWLRTLPTWLTGFGVIALFATGHLTVITYLSLTCLAVVAQLGLAWSSAGARPGTAVPLRPLITFGLRGAAGTALGFANTSLDQAVVGPLLGTAQLGYYAAAVSIATLPSTVAVGLAYRSFSDVAASASEEHGGDQLARASLWIRTTLLVAAVLMIGLLAVAPVAAPILYGHHFGERVLLPLYLLGPGVVALGASITAVNVFVAIGRPGLSTLIQVPGVVVTAGGLAIALPRWGIDGAAGVSSLAYLSILGTALILLRRRGARSLLPRTDDVARAYRRLPPRLRPSAGRLAAKRRRNSGQARQLPVTAPPSSAPDEPSTP